MTDVAEFDVFCPGMLEVLSIGKGDLKIVIDDNDEDRDKGRRLIEEMLRKGYSIFIEHPAIDGPFKVDRFDPGTMSYIIVEPDELAAGPAMKGLAAGPAQPAKRGPVRQRRVPVAGTKATAVGRTAGG